MAVLLTLCLKLYLKRLVDNRRKVIVKWLLIICFLSIKKTFNELMVNDKC